MKKVIALCLSVMICLGMFGVCSFATTDLDFSDGYVRAYDAEGNDFGGVYEVGHTFEYHLKLFVWSNTEEDYVNVEIEDTDTVTLSNALTEPMEQVAAGSGSIIGWTAAQAGYHAVEICLQKGENNYYGTEIYQIGEPWDMQNAHIEYQGQEVTDGAQVLYNNASIKKELSVFFYPAGEYLKEGEDYTLKVTNAKGPGKATITVVGKGKCVGTLVKQVDIVSPSAKFKDVKQKGWYVGAINFVISAELFSGMSKTTFEPDTAMTRAMFVTVAVRLMGLDDMDETPSHSFKDVPAGKYYSKAVAWASYLGIVSGVSPTEFAPDDKITREQMCAMLVRLNDVLAITMQQVGLDIDLEMSAGGNKFADHKTISKYAKTAVYACRNEGIVNGKPGNLFDPKGNATRAEVATILYNYAQFLTKALTA